MDAKIQVLFVDDDEFILSCFERLLGRRFTMETALGAEQAMEALKSGQYAVVASDLRMPGMNGIELLRKVRKEYPKSVGILLTGNPELDTAECSGNADLYFRLLAKPCQTAELIATIEEALEQHRLNTCVV